jgi:hypothetical protein
MPDSQTPIRGQAATFSVNGAKRGDASLQTFRPTRLGSLFMGETLVVTTADGTQYGFRGRTSNLQNDIAGALAGLGREVRATTTGLAVNSRALNGEG